MLISQQKITPKIKDFFGFTPENIVYSYVPNKRLYWVGSGRVALRQILLNIASNSLDKENIVGMAMGKSQKFESKLKVGIPSYTCHVVLDAVKRANCQEVFYDSGVIAKVEDIEKIINQIDVLVVCYNFGFMCNIGKIVQLCKENDVTLIEDCAQALGARFNNKLAGSFGDYAFYSFGISKNIGFCGGLIVTDSNLQISGLKKFPKWKLFQTVLEVCISPFFFNKYIYPFTSKFLKSELSRKQESLNYKIPLFVKKVILNQFKRYGSILLNRRRNAKYCLDKLKGVKFIKPINGSDSAWLYFCFLQHSLQKGLLNKGIELGPMKTFKSLSGQEKSLNFEKEVLTFAMHRKHREIVKACKVINGDLNE